MKIAHNNQVACTDLMRTVPEIIREAARGAGFDLAGIAPIGHFPEQEAFAPWIEAGYAGENSLCLPQLNLGKLLTVEDLEGFGCIVGINELPEVD